MRFTTFSGWMFAAMVGLSGLLAGCAQEPPRHVSTTRRYFADETGLAKSCTVPQVKPIAGKEVAATMTVGNDGGACPISVDSNGSPYGAGLLVKRPSHGRVFIHTVGDATRIDYLPARAYAGPDDFTVRLVPGGALIRTTVTVNRG